MKYIVTATSINRDDYKPFKINQDGSMWTREEEIDTTKNEIFSDCEGFYDVEDTYEAYWNRLNNNYKNKDIVKVLNVRRK